MIEGLRRENICIVENEALDKAGVLKLISDIAARDVLLKGRKADDIYRALSRREEVGSTGLDRGVAIPHCSFPDLEGFVTGLLIIPRGVDFHSLDGDPSRLVFFIVGPEDARNTHVHILSTISKLSQDGALLENIKAAASEERAMKLLEPFLRQVAGGEGGEKCLFTIVVQAEELFTDILEILSSEVEGAVTVVEANRAGSYLNRLPLFSAFWNDEGKGFSRIISAVVNKRMMNDTIRRINIVRPDDGRGVLITVNELLYLDGSIDF